MADLQVIIVNDGSTDFSPSMCDSFAAKDPRFCVIHKPNAGYGAAVNAGLDIAQGEYIGIVEPDDFIEPHMYQSLYDHAQATGADVSKAAYSLLYDIDNKLIRRPSSDGIDPPPPPQGSRFTLAQYPHLLSWHPSIWTCLYRRDFLTANNIRMQELPGACWQDNLFQVQTLVLAKSICYLPAAVYHYRKRSWNDSTELKDHTIPWQRTRTVHAWLHDQGITDPAIWAALHKREYAYAGLSLNHCPRAQRRQVFSLIHEWAKTVHDHPALIQILRRSQHKQLRQLARSPHHVYKIFRAVHLKNIRRFLFSINTNGDILIQLFGIQLTNKSTTTPYWLKIPLPGKRLSHD